MAEFECKIRRCPQLTCSVYWAINDSSIAHDHQQDQHEEQGFVFSHQRNTSADVYMGRVTIPASPSVNNTVLCCIIQDGRNPSQKSDPATLLVISGTVIIIQ